jgi:hypothetical protein
MDLRRIFSPQNSQKGRLFSANHYLMEKEWAKTMKLLPTAIIPASVLA